MRVRAWGFKRSLPGTHLHAFVVLEGRGQLETGLSPLGSRAQQPLDRWWPGVASRAWLAALSVQVPPGKTGGEEPGNPTSINELPGCAPVCTLEVLKFARGGGSGRLHMFVSILEAPPVCQEFPILLVGTANQVFISRLLEDGNGLLQFLLRRAEVLLGFVGYCQGQDATGLRCEGLCCL